VALGQRGQLGLPGQEPLAGPAVAGELLAGRHAAGGPGRSVTCDGRIATTDKDRGERFVTASIAPHSMAGSSLVQPRLEQLARPIGGEHQQIELRGESASRIADRPIDLERSTEPDPAVGAVCAREQPA
jgi:hypothetical protein